MNINPIEIIERHYAAHPKALEILLVHSRAVAGLAVEIAQGYKGEHAPDVDFVREAALLHDIGMLHTNAPSLGCTGELPYIHHGQLGRRMLEDEGGHLDTHALVCERHVGTGLSVADVRREGFGLIEREMVPQSIEEIIVCYADKFFSKNSTPHVPKPIDEVRASIARWGQDKLKAFDAWTRMLGAGQVLTGFTDFM